MNKKLLTFVKTYDRIIIMTALLVVVVLAAFINHIHTVDLRAADNNQAQTKTNLSSNTKSQSNLNAAGQTSTSTSSSTNQSSVTPKATSTPGYNVPTLPKAQEDPTIAWYDAHSNVTTQLGNDANSVDATLEECSTINPYAISLCSLYDGSASLNACQTMLNDVNSDRAIPAVPYAAANNYWQAALNSFQTSAQTCISKVNAHIQFGPDEIDVGFDVKTGYTTGVQDLSSMVSAITQYEQTL